MIINVTKEWRLKDLPLIVNRAREPWDFHLAFISESDDVDPDLVEINKTPISHFVVNKIGLDALLKLPDDGTVIDLEESVRAGFYLYPNQLSSLKDNHLLRQVALLNYFTGCLKRDIR